MFGVVVGADAGKLAGELGRGEVRRDHDVKRFFEASVLLEDVEIVGGSEFVSLVSGGDEVGDEDFAGTGGVEGGGNAEWKEIGDDRAVEAAGAVDDVGGGGDGG